MTHNHKGCRSQPRAAACYWPLGTNSFRLSERVAVPAIKAHCPYLQILPRLLTPTTFPGQEASQNLAALAESETPATHDSAPRLQPRFSWGRRETLQEASSPGSSFFETGKRSHLFYFYFCVLSCNCFQSIPAVSVSDSPPGIAAHLPLSTGESGDALSPS
ncbi:hypothetical protein LY78DRAFT_115 [Colletotrichum sublineola]|nr:hypothetical protein LY78DRAFT_115 [Colletotrichum sublineola]